MAYKVPSVITTCDYEAVMDGDYWYIYLKSSGTFAFKYGKTNVDVFLQGGGGGGGKAAIASTTQHDFINGGGGGAGGYQVTQYGQQISGSYVITIGEGGGTAMNGNATSAFGFNAEGGECGSYATAGTLGTAAGGNGGLYGGGGFGNSGKDGEKGKQAFGIGGVFYGAGGGGAAASFGDHHGVGGETGGGTAGTNGIAGNGLANTGSGGSGSPGGSAGKGGSGIIILRGTQDDQLPVKFDGVTLQSILYEGQEVMHLIHDGTKIFMERMRRWLGWSRRKTLSPLPVS